MKLPYQSLCFVSVLILLMLVATAQAQDIIVEDAWIRGVPHAAKTTAAFMTIVNPGPEEKVLKSVTSDVAKTLQVHTMEQVGEIMKMKQVNELRISANGKTVLAPKGYHIMLIGLVRPINEGETIPLSLNFADGTSVGVNAIVRKWAKMAPMSHN